MSIKDIPVVTEPAAARSGEKYTTPQGFTAIRDGIKPAADVDRTHLTEEAAHARESHRWNVAICHE